MDTSERRRGDQLTAKGLDRDPGRSSHAHLVQASGLRWSGCLGLPPIAWAQRVWALPGLTVVCPSERFSAQHGRRHHTVLDRAWQSIQRVRRWLPGRAVVLVADSRGAALAGLALVAQWPGGSVSTRLGSMLRSLSRRRRVSWDSAVARAAKGSVARPWRQSWRTSSRRGVS